MLPHICRIIKEFDTPRHYKMLPNTLPERGLGVVFTCQGFACILELQWRQHKHVALYAGE